MTTYTISSIQHWQNLTNTTNKIHSFLKIKRKLYKLTKKTQKTHNTSIIITYILQSYKQIQSTNNYLQILTEKSTNSSFS
ncbi:replication initiation protein RepC, partial [Klebsiella pneumoniae]|uniref:replication initiation protein RepC n=1 Tax=Klebsiella pneumoniae TaxID=573 RepID=UPI001D0D81A0